MTCPTCDHLGYCDHSPSQGRECLAALNATRAIFWLEPLNYIGREGGTKVGDNGPVPLFCDRCTVCAGQNCLSPDACQLPEPAPTRSIPTIVWARLIGIGLAIGAFVYVIAAMNARHLFL